MILAQLTRHWRARLGKYGTASWLLCVARSLRVLAFWPAHRALCRLDVYRDHVAPACGDDLFNHLSHRHYLARGLSARRRVQCALSHYRFEEASFDQPYRQAVYGGGLVLWQHADGANRFAIRLEMAARGDAEGDLLLALVANGVYLHRLSFSWVAGPLLGLDVPLLPFIARNQGRWTDSAAAFAAFEQAFPNNSPSFFCFSAMQGLAQALGIDRVLAVKCSAQVAYEPAQVRHFANAYDGFWKILGGVETAGPGFVIGLPFYLKPLAEMPSKHRKRAAQRREHWRAIAESARATLQRHLLRPPPLAARPAPLAEAAEA